MQFFICNIEVVLRRTNDRTGATTFAIQIVLMVHRYQIPHIEEKRRATKLRRTVEKHNVLAELSAPPKLAGEPNLPRLLNCSACTTCGCGPVVAVLSHHYKKQGLAVANLNTRRCVIYIVCSLCTSVSVALAIRLLPESSAGWTTPRSEPEVPNTNHAMISSYLGMSERNRYWQEPAETVALKIVGRPGFFSWHAPTGVRSPISLNRANSKFAKELAALAVRTMNERGIHAINNEATDFRMFYKHLPTEAISMAGEFIAQTPCIEFVTTGIPFHCIQNTRLGTGDAWINTWSNSVYSLLDGPSLRLPFSPAPTDRIFIVPLFYNVTAMTLCLVFIEWCIVSSRSRIRARNSCCIACGYPSQDGIGTCPECGAASRKASTSATSGWKTAQRG